MWGKYGNKRSSGGDSKLEIAVYEILKARERAGEIKNLQKQQTYVLQGGGRDTRITWRVDFSAEYADTGETFFIEAKGFETDVYRLKLKMFLFQGKHDLEIWKGSWRKPFCAERIPKK